MEFVDIHGKLSAAPGSLSEDMMKVRNPIAPRATWRDRFLEIARQAGGAGPRVPPALASGLRPRARMAGFATLRRGPARP